MNLITKTNTLKILLCSFILLASILSVAIVGNSTAYATGQTAMKGYWMFSSEAKYLTPAKAQALKDKGITDVFVCTRDASGTYHLNDLQNAIKTLHPHGIKVHAWLTVFKDNGQFVNPSTSTTTTQKVITGKN